MYIFFHVFVGLSIRVRQDRLPLNQPWSNGRVVDYPFKPIPVPLSLPQLSADLIGRAPMSLGYHAQFHSFIGIMTVIETSENNARNEANILVLAMKMINMTIKGFGLVKKTRSMKSHINCGLLQSQKLSR